MELRVWSMCLRRQLWQPWLWLWCTLDKIETLSCINVMFLCAKLNHGLNGDLLGARFIKSPTKNGWWLGLAPNLVKIPHGLFVSIQVTYVILVECVMVDPYLCTWTKRGGPLESDKWINIHSSDANLGPWHTDFYLKSSGKTCSMGK